jgi:hypothetical protein
MILGQVFILLWFAWNCFAADQYRSALELFLLESPGIVEYTPETLTLAVSNPRKCTAVVVGATWDGHFKHWVLNRRVWVDLAAQYAASNENSDELEFGFLIYASGVHGTETLPNVAENAWTSASPGSFQIRIFKDGKVLRNSDLEFALRNQVGPESTTLQDLLNHCRIYDSTHDSDNKEL